MNRGLLYSTHRFRYHDLYIYIYIYMHACKCTDMEVWETCANMQDSDSTLHSTNQMMGGVSVATETMVTCLPWYPVF